jgi:DNA replication protein DnaC
MTTDMMQARVKALKLHGLLAHWEETRHESWVSQLLQWEEEERSQRGLNGRLKSARIGRFKPMANFDWAWPKKCDREAIEEFMNLAFTKDAINIILCGPNGVGKSTIAKNIAYQGILHGHTALFTTASHMLKELATQDGDQALQRKLKYYTQPQILVIDEVGYLSYSNRCADLLFEVISRRYHNKSTVITTNKPFSEWSDIFPNAACVVSLIDRLVHRSEIINIEADSYRLKEAKEESAKRKATREAKKSKIQNEKNGEAAWSTQS